MGSICYDFLAESILFDDKALSERYSSLNDEALNAVLEDYRDHILSNRKLIEDDIIRMKSSLKVFSTIDRIPESTLIQSALYIDQFIIDDPLFKLAHRPGAQSQVTGQYLGYQDSGLDRDELVKTMSQLKNITTMVAGDYVKFLPVSWLFEPQEQTPIYYSRNFFEDSLPPEIQKFCKEHAQVRSMTQVEKGWQMLSENDLTPGLYVGFGDDLYKNGMMYHYFEQQFFPTDDPTIFHAAMNLAKYPMAVDVWNGWVKQSINRSAINLVDKVYKEVSIAASLSATYLTNQNFTASLIEKSFNAEINPENITANQVLNLKLPYVDKINVDKLMEIRNSDQDAIANFRIELERQFRELRFVTDPKELMERQENILHELGVSGVHKINTKLNSLRKKAVLDGAIMLGGLAGSVVSGGWSLLAAAVAGASGYKTYVEYQENLKENPSYLMWKVLK
ncbi:MAG: hypothetical protein ACXVAY_00225 [Mucilaginibacter sp.]